MLGGDDDQYFLYFLYKKYSRSLWGYAYHLAKDKNVADDIVQTAFLQVINHVKTLRNIDHENKLKAYLNRTIKNTYLNYLKKNKNQPIFIELEELENVEDSFVLENSVLHKMQTKDWLEQIYKTLSEKEKDIITLYYFVGLSQKEVAEVLGTSQSNMGVILYHLKKRLRNNFKFGGNGEYEKA